MRGSTIGRRIFLVPWLLASLGLACALVVVSVASGADIPKPHASTGGVSRVRGTSGLLDGTVNPHGSPTTYFFQYGPTIAYGSQTPSASAGSGNADLKVGQTVTGLLSGYHYRIVAVNAIGGPKGTAYGKDRTFTTKSTRLKVEIEKPSEAVVYGSATTVSGEVTGIGNANQGVVLQGSPYPYHEPFTNIGAAGVSGPTGRYAFRIPKLTESMQVRVVTLAARPVFSVVVTEHVAVRVTLKSRSAGRPGFVRLFGTIAPAEVGAKVLLQLQKPARPHSRSEKTVTFATEQFTVAKRATRTLSRFSIVASIRHAGRYRAYVVIGHGPLVSGASNKILLHAAPAKPKGHTKKS